MIRARTARLQMGFGLLWIALSRVKARSFTVCGMAPRWIKAVAVNSAVFTFAAHGGRARLRTREFAARASSAAVCSTPVSASCTLRHVPAHPSRRRKGYQSRCVQPRSFDPAAAGSRGIKSAGGRRTSGLDVVALVDDDQLEDGLVVQSAPLHQVDQPLLPASKAPPARLRARHGSEPPAQPRARPDLRGSTAARGR